MKAIFYLYIFALSAHTLVAQSISKTIKRLPDTGQTKSFTDTYGEDNDYTENVPYYIDNGDGTIARAGAATRRPSSPARRRSTAPPGSAPSRTAPVRGPDG